MVGNAEFLDDDEQFELVQRILQLRDDQLTALCHIAIGFSRETLPAVVQDIRENAMESEHLAVMLAETESPEDLEWWVELFEEAIRNGE
ncbi:MAG: hypothetical protein COT71_04015 [Candidatus Andersenbacteria bacterium CG10_big_fil_rev_8_21_14_0_10_54_11]|uniref:Uncharacterized protein n=1 Tax=Candidatus Andersenbacteria bacterium CG10_big_fil_rev_8_21_14_0_10_54_11 TaxID=1974485 RepID=A0A2M6WYH7_9BACT|nr:MAG: hypothetical protein COT71_04015 [Candidatus Andersenbacteria bacterium CG10_big_fil_rev_8_21_14_0_10_54_11]